MKVFNKRGLIVRLLVYAIILIVVGGWIYSMYLKYSGNVIGKISLNQEDNNSNNAVEDISVGGEAENDEQTSENNIREIEENSAKFDKNDTNETDNNQTYYIQSLSENKTNVNSLLKNYSQGRW